MDPIEASFEGTAEEVQLDPSDAVFVDVIHTDSAPLIPFLGETHSAPASSMSSYVLTTIALHYKKLIAGQNISGFGMNQLVGHLDFFPNEGENMPGCKKNALSQIVDLDGIWAGTTLVRMRGVGRASLPWSEQCLSRANVRNDNTSFFKNIQFPFCTLFQKNVATYHLLYLSSTDFVLP